MVTTVERTLIDVAAMLEPTALRKALAQADHRKLLSPPSLLAQIRRGQPGGRALRQALGQVYRASDAVGADLRLQLAL